MKMHKGSKCFYYNSLRANSFVMFSLLLIVVPFYTNRGNCRVPNLHNNLNSDALNNDARNISFYHHKERRRASVKQLRPTKGLTLFERKTKKLHKMTNILFKRLENSERNSYLSKLSSFHVSNKKKTPIRFLSTPTKVHHRKHFKQPSKAFQRHTRKLHLITDKILQILEHNEKKYYLSKIKNLSH